MQFELKENYRNIPDESLISDLQNVAHMLGKNTLSRSEYKTYGKYSYTTIERRFKTWNKAMILAELEPIETYSKTNADNINVSDEEIINDIKRVADLLHKKNITTTEYTTYGSHGRAITYSRFGSWENVLKYAGLEPTIYHHKVTNQELLEELGQVWIKLERQPTTNDIRNGISKYSLNSYCRHFGSWNNALRSFISYINDDTVQMADDEDDGKNNESISKDKIIYDGHKTKRDISDRLRYRVLIRDNCKCCICGASPAKNPEIELHIDHIVPWSKGGETTIDNLRVLCSKCNLGKGDLLE